MYTKVWLKFRHFGSSNWAQVSAGAAGFAANYLTDQTSWAVPRRRTQTGLKSLPGIAENEDNEATTGYCWHFTRPTVVASNTTEQQQFQWDHGNNMQGRRHG